MRRRLIIALAVLAVLVAGVVAAVVVHRLRASADVRGSSSVEFTTTTAPANPPPAQAEWPTYGFDAARTRALDLPLRPPFRPPVWTYHAGSLIEFPPAIAYGRLYFSTNAGAFHAVNAKTGKRAWVYVSHRCVAASPAIGPSQHGTIYATFMNRPPCNASAGGHGNDGKVIAFAASFGKIRWSRTIGVTESSPLLVGDTLYVGDWNGDVWALNSRTGRPLWRFHTGGPVKGAVATDGHRLYVGSYDGHVYCLSFDGKRVWRASAQQRLYGGSQFYSTPAVAYGRVYIGSTDHKVYSYGATTGKLRWSTSTGNYVYASPAVWKDLVLVGSYDRRFYALDAATGARRWSFAANGPISGSATVIGNVVYFATLARRTYALSARTGKLLWTFDDGKYTPAVGTKDMLYLVGYGQVYGMVPRVRSTR